MTIKIFDYTDSTEDIFYKIIYPVYAKEFLYGSNYENFVFLVQANFKLNSNQWQKILEHWELKESILNIKIYALLMIVLSAAPTIPPPSISLPSVEQIIPPEL